MANDGGLLDIIVDGTTEHDWRLLLSAIRSSPWSLDYTWSGSKHDLPTTFGEIDREVGSPRLLIGTGSLNCQCFFRDVGQIVFDFEPLEFQDPKSFEPLEMFIRWLSRTLGRTIFITPNNVNDIRLVELKAGSLS